MRHFLLHVEIKDGTRTVEANVLRALKVPLLLITTRTKSATMDSHKECTSVLRSPS